MASSRIRVPRPRGGRYTYACTACRLMLDDGVEYTWCPRCSGEVDWVDGSRHVWMCEVCNVPVGANAVAPPCPDCAGPLSLLSIPVVAIPRVPRRTMSAGTVAAGLFVFLLVVQAILAVLDPTGFPYLTPLLLLVQIAALAIVVFTLVASREFRALASYRTTRVIHGLEHATARVLEERGVAVASGETFHGMFMLVLPHDGTTYERLETTVREAATDAISRIRFGERHLALHARCGTSALVGIALLAFAIVAAGITALVLAVPVGITFALTVAAGLLARLVAKHAGLLAQRLLTVSTEFASARVTLVEKRVSADGDTLTAIVMVDVIPRAVDISAVGVV